MSASLPTDAGDSISQSNASDADGGISSNGNYSATTNSTDDGSSTMGTDSETDSAGATPLLYLKSVDGRQRGELSHRKVGVWFEYKQV